MKRMLFLIAGVFCQYSYACFIHAEFKFEDIVVAEAVFVGELINYEIADPDEEYAIVNYAVLTFEIIEYLEGELAEKEIEVYWHNSTFGVPSSLGEGRYLVAITNNKQPPLRGPSATTFPTQRPDLASVLQAPCSDPFLLEANNHNIGRAKELLTEKSAK